LSVKAVPTFADRGCHVVSVTDPYGRILSPFNPLDRRLSLVVEHIAKRKKKKTDTFGEIQYFNSTLTRARQRTLKGKLCREELNGLL
jgi:hypothetical protein